ncbi:MAG: serine/threonine-protein kinase [Prosthecobacter sp.]
MNDITCQTCGKPLPEDAPQGICPACLLERTIQDSSAAPQPPELEMQQLAAAFPQLVIEEMIGQGGMGRVYRAQQPHLNRTVALKVLSAERVGHPEWLERFGREARALARLSHPHIVQVYDFGEKPLPYLLMEHVDGVNLRQAMQDGGLTAREALTIVPKLCDALHYAHEHGVLHRDIKPENILIDTEGRVKLVDFGLAKLRDEGVLPFTLTQSGTKLGTMAYMAPEQVEKPAEVDHRADIYSLGVVFYEMLTGELPLGRFPTPSEASGVDRRLDSVVLRTLEKRKEKRFQDAAEMRSGLEQAQTQAMQSGDAMSREMFITIVLMALWPVAAVILSFQLAMVARVIVALCSSVLLAVGILRLRQQLKGHEVRSYYPERITALLLSAIAFLDGPFWGPFFMCLIVAFAWLRAAWKEGAAERPPGSMSFIHGLLSLASAVFVFLGIVTITAVVHEWLHATMRTKLPQSGIHAVDALGLFVALTGAMPRIRRAWHQLQGRPPTSRVMSPSTARGLCALAAVLLTPSFESWKPRLTINGRQVWQIVAAVPAAPAGTARNKAAHPGTQTPSKQQEHESLLAKRRSREEEAKPLHAKSNAWVARATKAGTRQELNVVLQEMTAALQSKDPASVRPGLMALRGLYQMDFDRAPFRELARQHLGSADPDVRVAALHALMTCLPDDSDRQRVLALVPSSTEEELPALAFAMKTVSKSDFTGEFAAPMLAVLERGMEAALRDRGNSLAFDARGVLGAIWGAKVSPQIEARLIEWSRLGENADGILTTNSIGYDVFYHALSVQSNKSLAAVRRILALARNPDTTNIAGRCLWGLNDTVPEKRDQALVASEVITLLGMRDDDYLWRRGLTLISKHAGPDDLDNLEALAGRKMLPKERQEALNKIIADIQDKQ